MKKLMMRGFILCQILLFTNIYAQEIPTNTTPSEASTTGQPAQPAQPAQPQRRMLRGVPVNPEGAWMSHEQVQELTKNGFEVTGVPSNDGSSIFVTKIYYEPHIFSDIELHNLEKLKREQKISQTHDSLASHTIDYYRDLLNELYSHHGFSRLFGFSSVPPWIPGTSGADARAVFRKIDPLTFAEAINKMITIDPVAFPIEDGMVAIGVVKSLDPSMSEKNAKNQITLVKIILEKFISKRDNKTRSEADKILKALGN